MGLFIFVSSSVQKLAKELDFLGTSQKTCFWALTFELFQKKLFWPYLVIFYFKKLISA
jgi:hypothetical protein